MNKGWMGTALKRDDENVVFIRLDTREVVVWVARANGWLWHATSDGVHAVCNVRTFVDVAYNPWPTTVDRSNDIMTCVHCQGKVAVKKRP